jgi:hypothetical protein
MLRWICLITCATFLWSLVVFAQEPGQPGSQPPDVSEQFSATGFFESGPASGKSVGINIYVNSYTTDEERNNFLDILKKQGQDGLESAFDKAKERGRISVTGSTGNSVPFIRSHNAETRRIIRMATNRIMSFAELSQSPRSRDYKFTIVELRLDASGNGDGSIFYATKLKFDKSGELVLEHYGQKPIRLANVRKQK